jgi:orotidine-5'-phosphate decarboxylase
MTHIVVALDVPSSPAALGLVDELGGVVSWYKIGSPLFTRSGPSIVRELRARGKKVFLDLKYHDIPSTVARALEAAAALDVQLLTVHASGGSAMMKAAREAVGTSGPAIVAVTILTSLGPGQVEEVWRKPVTSVRDEVLRLAELAQQAGLDGVVASPLETQVIKQTFGSNFLVVNPGIRPTSTEQEDQARTATPAGATRAGADFLVIGRPIVEAPDRTAAVEEILAEIHGVTTVAS